MDDGWESEVTVRIVPTPVVTTAALAAAPLHKRFLGTVVFPHMLLTIETLFREADQLEIDTVS
jgi:hypothetical protein